MSEPQSIQEIPSHSRSELVFNDHTIELIAEPGAAPFSEEHISKITPILQFYWDIDPRCVQGYAQFISENRDELSEDGRFPLNGENRPCIGKGPETHGAIWFTQRGMDTTIAHRISPVNQPHEHGFIDNFTGTVAHELAHGGGTQNTVRAAGFLYDKAERNDFFIGWQRKFGWRTQIVNGKVTFTTSRPELCIGGPEGYAATRPEEDICDSIAAFALNSPLLHEEKKEFIRLKIEEYKKNRQNRAISL